MAVPRQLLTSINALPERSFDAVVIGAGVAGLTFALHLAPSWRILLLTKGDLGESNTRYAQGGISAAIGVDDSTRLHEEDTVVAGAGLCDVDAVRQLVDGAPQAVEWLVEIGAEFDRDAEGAILLGREAAHGRRRVLHAGGDATGHEVERALVAEASRRPNIEVWQHASAIDLIVDGGSVIGAIVEDRNAVRWRCGAQLTVIAAGGAGQIWEVTSNPSGATADGLAMAIRAGAAIADCEFVQFHPTVLALSGWDAFLVSEAVRGEGAYLRDEDGERFMVAQHPSAELAPRDVVARGIHRQLVNADGAFLDVRHLDADSIRARFPTIARELAERGLDLASDLIPMSPAAHYFMGGVAAQPDGRTSLPGLLALGEAACTGIHGANRLASNSLLEGLVFGRIAAERANLDFTIATAIAESMPSVIAPNAPLDHAPERTSELRARIQRVMSTHVGVDRTADGLKTAIAELEEISAETETLSNSLSSIIVVNMVQAAQAIAGAALHREESRGGHFRSDFPDTDATLENRHSLFRGSTPRWIFGSLSEAIHGSAMSPEYVAALQRFWDRSDYDKGIITNPFGFDDSAGERGLARTRGVVERLGNPLARVPVIHVAGSKGKGSTTAFIANILTAAGYRTGRYSSPHLHSFRERIVIDERPISESDFARAFDRALAAAEQLERDQPELGRVTAFELITVAAFDHFAQEACDVAVIETGLGGRWDSSNVVDPLVSVITLIDLEHTDVLGDTLAEIAFEKAGIIKPARPVVTLDQDFSVLDVFRRVVSHNDASLAIEGFDWRTNLDWTAFEYDGVHNQIGPIRLGLHGEHQARNAGLALAALFSQEMFPVSSEAVVRGLARTWLPARYELIPAQATLPSIVIDGAHSPASAHALAKTLLHDFPERSIAIVFSMLNGKDVRAAMTELSSVSSDFWLVESASPRAMPVSDLAAAAHAAGIDGQIASSVSNALAAASDSGAEVIVVTGSLAFAAEARVALGLAETEVIPKSSENQ